MSKFQLTVLGLLGLIACGLFVAVGIVAYTFVYQPQQQVSSPPTEISSSSEQENTPISAPTATATLHPTATPIPGWKKFEGGDVEMWLPPSYEGGDSVENLEMIVGLLRELGAGYEPLAQGLEQDPQTMPFFAYDKENLGTIVNVTIRETPIEMSLEDYMAGYSQALQEQPYFEVRVTEQKIVKLENYEAGQLLLEIGTVETPSFQLAYVIKEGNTVWTVNYGALPEQIGQQLPIFQQSIETFRVKK